MSDLFNEEIISQATHTKWAGKTVHFARETDSTNLWGKRAWREEGAGHGELFVAEYQSAGRGRFTRRWSAPPDSAITMSILICPEFSPQKAPMLTLVMGLSVAQAVRELDIEVSIKWPNDIYWKDKKICGMLIENDLMGRNISQSISGIGINVNQEVFHSTAPNPVSLRQITGKQYDIFEILKNIMLRIQSGYELLRNGDTEPIAHRYEKALFRKEGMHRYKDADGEFFARIICVEPEGKLILEDDAQRKRGYMFKEVEYLLI